MQADHEQPFSLLVVLPLVFHTVSYRRSCPVGRCNSDSGPAVGSMKSIQCKIEKPKAESSSILQKQREGGN